MLINLFTLDAWTDGAAFMKRPSTQPHRTLGDSSTYLNYAVWDSTETFRAACTHPEFIAKLSAYPSSTVANPHLFQKVAIVNICTA